MRVLAAALRSAREDVEKRLLSHELHEMGLDVQREAAGLPEESAERSFGALRLSLLRLAYAIVAPSQRSSVEDP